MNLAWILDTVTCTETRRDDLCSHPAAGRMLPLRPSHPMCHAGCRLPHLCWPPPVSSVSISLLLNLLSLVLQCWLCRLEASLRPPPCPTTSLAGSVLVTHRMWRDVVFYLFFFPFQPTDTGISSLGTRCHGNCTSSQLQQQWGRGISLTQKAAGGACCDAWTNPMGGHGFMGQGGCRVPALILAAGSAGCCSYLPQLTAWVLCPSGTETCSHPSWVTFWG